MCFPPSPEFFCVPGPVLGSKETKMNWPDIHPLQGLVRETRHINMRITFQETSATLEGQEAWGSTHRGSSKWPCLGKVTRKLGQKARRGLPVGKGSSTETAWAKAWYQQNQTCSATVRCIFPYIWLEEGFLVTGPVWEPVQGDGNQTEKRFICQAKAFGRYPRSLHFFLTFQGLPR